MSQVGFTPISIYYSATASNVPTAGNLVAGELAINTADGRLYYKDSSGVVQTLASKAGALGDVVGPASATDNALARFDATTGKLIQNSVGILSDAGALSGLTGLTSSGSITLSSLTSGRVTYAGTAGLLQDSANLTFSSTVTSIGVAPSTWSLAGYYAAEIGVAGNAIYSGLGDMNFSCNSTYNGGWKYAATGVPVGLYSINTNTHIWKYAAAGTVGNAITFTEAMRIDSSGNVGIGTTPSGAKLDISGSGVVNLKITSTSSNAQLILNSSGTNVSYINYGQTGANPLAFYDSNSATERMRIDSSGNVGIGTSSPTNYGAGYKSLAINGTSSGILELQANGTTQALLVCDASDLQIQANSTKPIRFFTNSLERMRVNASAPILCLAGGSTTATGTGIAFPATQSASTDANTLDDYEEGTFTPALSWLGTITYSSQSGTYTKVGRLVTCTVFISASSTDTTQDATTMNFSSLPFTVSSASPSCAMTENIKGTISATAPNTFFVYPTGTTTTAAMYQNNYNGTTAQKSYYGGLPRSGYNGGLAVIVATFSYLTST